MKGAAGTENRAAQEETLAVLFQLGLIERDAGRLGDAQRRMLEAADIAP